ncbi:hypothetical protein FRC06_004794, partial [Ceratobasidium sp. 370]
MKCHSQIIRSLDPGVTLTEAMETKLGDLISKSPAGHPATYASVSLILMHLAGLLDNSQVTAPKNMPAFFPTPGVAPTQTASRALGRFKLRLHLLDNLLYILFPAARLPMECLHPASAPTNPPGTCPKQSSLHGKAEWILASVANMNVSVAELISNMIGTNDLSSTLLTTTGEHGSAEHNEQVSHILDQLVDYHSNASVTHAYLHQFVLIAKGLWGMVTPKKKNKSEPRIDHAEKLLDLATGSSIVVPMLRQYFKPKVTWAHNEMSADLAVK